MNLGEKKKKKVTEKFVMEILKKIPPPLKKQLSFIPMQKFVSLKQIFLHNMQHVNQRMPESNLKNSQGSNFCLIINKNDLILQK